MLMKWLVLIAIVAAVWFGFRAIARRNLAKQATAAKEDRAQVEDMSACPVCGTFVPEGQRSCGKPGCPY